MAEEGESDVPAAPAARRHPIRRRVLFALLFIVALAFIAFWTQRKDIADNVIGNYLRARHIQATYHIDRVGGTRQVLSRVVVGDPQHPALTIERAEVVLRYRLGFPAISRVILTKPRLFGTFVHGKLSFGALDPVIFTGKQGAFALPDYALELNDGRALLETDYGPIGIKADGKGPLSNGFAGVLAATAPKLLLSGCQALGTTLYGRVAIKDREPTFKGPLRLQSFACASGPMRLAETNLAVDARLDRDFGGVRGKLAGMSRNVRYASAAIRSLRLKGDLAYRGGELNAGYDLVADNITHPQASFAHLTATGSVRAGSGFKAMRIESAFDGRGVRPGASIDARLAGLASSTAGTFIKAAVQQLRSALRQQSVGSTLAGQMSLNKTAQGISLVVPQASVTGGSGERLLSLSRFQYGGRTGGLPRLSGNFATGGQGIPTIEGRIEQRASEGFTAQLAMATYRAPGASIALPSLAIVSKGDRLGFAGRAILSGDLPGGHAEGLLLPISGYWSSGAGLALWRQCTRVTFDTLRYANLTLERHGLTVCPARGMPIVRYGRGGLKIAAGVPSLDVAGRLGGTPVAISSGPIGFAYPGTLAARDLHVSLSPSERATKLAIGQLTAKIGKTISGRFGGTDVRLAPVQFEFADAAGAWDYTDGRFAVTDGAFRLVDLQQPVRFNPLVARGASLSLKDNVIVAEALMREPKTDAAVTRLDVRHDLTTGRGHADLTVEGLHFGPKLQPEALFPRTKGVVANVAGTVTGSGRIDWDERGMSSSGRFSSDSLDLAAAFGPVKGASGTVVFTDLLGLTTAPDQMIRIGSVNPGIEVTGGEISFSLKNGQVLALNRGTWPFMGGTLTMRPVTLNLGVSEQRAYVLEIHGLEAAQFVEHMQLENLSATGTFDGEIPLIFDVDGNGRIEGGHLQSRGGGNVAYVGALTYKDLSPMANVTFDALRSLDYKKMDITVEGPLTGEIITHVRFDGVSQGQGAKQNFITRRIGKLPFRFVVTVTAPFYQLIANIRSMYDPTMIRNPQELANEGKLVDQNGNAVSAGSLPNSPPLQGKPTPDEANIQRRESETKP